MFNKSKFLFYFVIILVIVGCVETPINNIDNNSNNSIKAAYVLCEGLMGYNNSSITKIDLINGSIDNNYYENLNNGLKLGDTANDIVLKGDTAYITVLGSQSIEILNLKTGNFINRIILNGVRAPRKIAIVNDSLALVSDLYDNSVTAFNPTTFKIIKDNIKVGPQPEGMEIVGNYLIVCNSAYGDFNAKHPDAETVSIVDIQNFNEKKKIKTGANTIEARYNPKNNKIYIAYYNLPSRVDSVGGILQFSATDFSLEKSWITNVRAMNFSQTMDTLYFINQTRAGIESKGWKGISFIDLKNNQKIQNHFENTNKTDIWYGLTIRDNGEFWIANAKNHHTNGEILVFDSKTSSIIKTYKTGLNPNKIIFH